MVGNSIISFSVESIVLCDRKIDLILKKIEIIPWLFSKIDENKSILSIFKKDRRSKINGSVLIFWHVKGENCQKHTKHTFFFLIESIVFCDPKIDKIDSITVDLFQRSTRSIRSRTIFFKDRKDQKIEDRKIEFPTLGIYLS